jgi:predicted site-specific integrase-resolvase
LTTPTETLISSSKPAKPLKPRKSHLSSQEELVKELIAIILSFSAKMYGQRSNKARRLVNSVKEAIRT